MSLEITQNHIRFWDAHKLRLAHAALEGSEARQKLAALYLASDRVRRRLAIKTAPPAFPPAPSVHILIPVCDRKDSIFHRRAFGRQKARNARGKDHHLQGNLAGFIAGKVRRGESFDQAVLYYCAGGTGTQPYAKFAKRWAKKLKILAA